MNIQQCKYVVLIAKVGSFSKAAKQLYVTQPSLSNAVKSLESELGVTLFLRSKAGISLTDEGRDFLVFANQILDQVSLLENRYQQDFKKRFTVTTQHYDFLSTPFVEVMNQFQDHYQNFHLIETTTQKIISSVQDFESDLGVLYLDENNQKVLNRYFQQEDLHFEPLGKYKTQIFLRRDHPLSHEKLIHMKDLQDYPQVRFTQEDHNSSYFSEDPLEVLADQPVIYTNDKGTLTNLLCGSDAYASGLGIIDSFVKDHLVLIPLANATSHTLGILWNKNRKQSPISKSFVANVKETLSKWNETQGR